LRIKLTKYFVRSGGQTGTNGWLLALVAKVFGSAHAKKAALKARLQV
jgi:hypothetical protein